MKLAEHHIDILRSVRTIIEQAQPGKTYICVVVMDECNRRNTEEQNLWWNTLMFWRKFGIRKKWDARCNDLTRAIQIGLRGESTLGNWFEWEVRKLHLNMPDFSFNNNRMYRQMRLAWLDRIIETGEIK